MRGKRRRYTFVMEYLGGTYVRQGAGESPELALRAWLRGCGEEEFEWAADRDALLEQLADQPAVAVEGCDGVWCVSGLLLEELFLIHIIASDGGHGEGTQVAEAEQAASEPRRWGWGDRR